MIAQCPVCSARFRLDPQRHGGKRITLRCARCQASFTHEVISAPVDQGKKAAALEVLVAHGDRELCATIAGLLATEGIACRVCGDGHSALRMLRQLPPHVAVIDVALPGLYAFEVIEQLRRTPALERVKVILLSSVYNKTAYKRTPTSLYGADDYLEKHHIPVTLVSKIRQLTASGEEAKGRGTKVPPGVEQERPFVEALNAQIRLAEEQETDVDLPGPVLEKVRRLARIIVSDIALYHQERVDEGIRAGDLSARLAEEIEEGHRLLRSRFAPDLLQREDFLQQAITAFIERRRLETEV